MKESIKSLLYYILMFAIVAFVFFELGYKKSRSELPSDVPPECALTYNYCTSMETEVQLAEAAKRECLKRLDKGPDNEEGEKE